MSFNEKVEETVVFKSKDSVCQMHKTLLNRRKKQRQRQNRKEENMERRRRNSSTEHTSSGEESTKVSLHPLQPLVTVYVVIHYFLTKTLLSVLVTKTR